ncbi:hypothetical protein [Sphingobium yanoikuyae]|uniref:hypothetical protein n=1 Tax=Sphingobium yanoikuyae TaxID=13690 RepID=UPI0026EB53B3|nr:hypothetical protein [Sphingobium yanoikuyae]
MIRAMSNPSDRAFVRNPWVFGGNLRSTATGTVISFCKEITVPNPTIPFATGIPHDPVDRLTWLIAAARIDMAAAEAEAAMAEADMEAIEPHPYAHGHTAGGDCRYAGFQPEHRLALAGLLTRPWRHALATLEVAKHTHDLDYLLKAFPSVLDADRDALANEGAAALIERGVSDADRFAEKPLLAIGIVWRAFGFHHRDRRAWVGAFAYRGGLHNLVLATAGVTSGTTLGDALTTTVQAHSPLLSQIGQRELHDRAARRDAERQASWASVDADYREHGSWRSRAPTRHQRRLMQRIEATRSLPMGDASRRGVTSDWITAAGGNPRFDPNGGEKA